MQKKLQEKEDHSTEEKIKEAARKLFTQKGYAATKTRDIAKEAGINSALLNYYFRSKEKLFGIIMHETLQHFMQGVSVVANEEHTTLEEKIEKMVNHYIDLLSLKPEIPLFVINEVQANPKELLAKVKIEDYILKSRFFQQLREAAQARKSGAINPLHLMANIMGLIIFPFLGRPILQNAGNLNDEAYQNFLMERRKLIPQWVKAMVKG